MKRLALLAVLVSVLASLVGGPATATASETTLTVTSDRSNYVAGMSASVRVQVQGGNNGTLVIQARLANGQTKTLGCGGFNVNDSTFDCTVLMIYNTRIIATINGVTEDRLLLVRPSITSYPTNRRAFSNNKALFYVGDEPLYSTAVGPHRPTMCIKHQVEVKRASGWQPLLTGSCKAPDSKGRVAWRWYGKHPSGYDFRVRGYFTGDSKNIAGPGAWAYLRFYQR